MSATDKPADVSAMAGDDPGFANERRIFQGIVLVIGLAVAVALGSVLGITQLREDGLWVARAQEASEALDEVLLTVTEAEAASRGYALSGDVAYLKLHGEAALAIGPALLRLGRLIDDDAVQLQRFDRLSNLVERRLGVIRLLIETRRRDGVEAARTVVAGGEGKRLQDDIRALAGEMRTREKGLLQQRLAQSERSARMALAAVALGSLLAIGIAAMANYLIRRDFSGSRRAHAALREVNALLDRRVAERTAELQRANDRLQLADAVFRNTQESIVITDPETRVVAVNPAFSMVTEYPADEVIGQSVRLLRSGWHDESFYQQLWASLDATGNWQGEIWSRRRGGDVYQEWLSISTVHDAQGKLTHYIGVGVDLSRMNHAKTLLEHLAHHDALTGLPNRLLLHSRLEHSIERARRDKTLCAVLFIDLDRFKEVNDTLGHAAGDELLKLAAERMQLRLRDVDTLGRLGGDEFVVVLERVGSEEGAAEVAGALVEQLSSPFLLSSGRQVRIGASVGISLFPRDAERWDELLDRADVALYSAKNGGRGRWCFAAPDRSPFAPFTADPAFLPAAGSRVSPG